jgi:hypothetical protein
MSSVFLIQILLPLYDNEGNRQPELEFRRVSSELAHRFGGLTAFTRAPAEGIWKDDAEAHPKHDEIVVLEVMTDVLDRNWWSDYRRDLERRFRQEEIVIRAQTMEQL